MEKLTALALVGLVLGSGFLYSSSYTTTATDYRLLIKKTANDLAGVTLLQAKNPARTIANLQSKLDCASTELAEGKVMDAVDQLVDFRTTVELMAAAATPKISQADAELLVVDVNNAIAWIQCEIARG